VRRGAVVGSQTNMEPVPVPAAALGALFGALAKYEPDIADLIVDGVFCKGSKGGRFWRSADGAAAILHPGTGVTQYTFYNCHKLTQVTLPKSSTRLGDYTLCGCSGVTEVTLPDSLTYIGDYTFCGCGALRAMCLPDSLTHIGEFAFFGCTGLTQLTLPSTLTHIGSGAFYGCAGLAQITLPAGVKVGDEAFHPTTIVVTRYARCRRN
jgi:hypothetical protein